MIVLVDVDVVCSGARRGFQAPWRYRRLCKMRTGLGSSARAACGHSAPTKGSCVGRENGILLCTVVSQPIFWLRGRRPQAVIYSKQKLIWRTVLEAEKPHAHPVKGGKTRRVRGSQLEWLDSPSWLPTITCSCKQAFSLLWSHFLISQWQLDISMNIRADCLHVASCLGT